ncbi:MAG: sigma-70 family RNA polymerase sigma factor [Victivallaceae bacterium]
MTATLEKLKRNDREAWSELYEANVNGIYRYSMFRCSSNVSASEEITQQVFLTAVDRIESFSGAEDKLPGWLFGIAKIEILRHFRRKDSIMASAININDVFIEPAATDETAFDDGMGMVDKVLAKMQETQRQVLVFKYCEDISVSEISQRTGRTQKSVESLLSRGREAFKKFYTQILGETERG